MDRIRRIAYDPGSTIHTQGAGGEQMGQVVEAGVPCLRKYSAGIPRRHGRFLSVVISLVLGFTYFALEAVPAQARIAAAIVIDEDSGKVVDRKSTRLNSSHRL